MSLSLLYSISLASLRYFLTILRLAAEAPCLLLQRKRQRFRRWRKVSADMDRFRVSGEAAAAEVKDVVVAGTEDILSTRELLEEGKKLPAAT